MQIKRLLLLILLFIFQLSLFPNSKTNIDSLKAQLSKSDEKQKLHLLINISDYYLSNSLDSCFVYASQALLLAKKQNIDSLIANSYNKMGIATHYKGNNAKAIEYFTLAIEKYKAVNDQANLAASCVNIGVIYYSNGNYSKAIENYKLATQTFKHLNNKAYLSRLYDNLGLCYQQIDSTDVAIKYFKKAIEIKKSLNNISDIYNSLSSISMVYRLKGEFDKALYNYNKILNYAISGKDNRKIAITYLDIGECYLGKKEYNKAIRSYNKGLDISKKAKLNSLSQTLYLALSQLYEQIGNNANALKYYKLYADNKVKSQNDIVYKKLEEDIAQIKEEKIRYQNKLDEVKLERQKNISLILIITVILILIISIIILFQIKLHRRKNKELKKLLKAISKSEKDLKESNATKDKFFSIIAHDLRNPLSAFISVADILILKSDTISEEMQADFLQKIKKSADDLNNLLDNLLSWARSQMNKIEYYPQIFDLNLKINEIIILNQNFAGNKSIKIINKIEGELDVFADDNLIKTIIRNLISNAIKFTPSKGKIIISAYEYPDKIELHIADNGIGISKEKLNDLFKIKAFKKESELVNEQGTGLGLVICKEFIEINKGELKVISQENKGSDFIITLPKHR